MIQNFTFDDHVKLIQNFTFDDHVKLIQNFTFDDHVTLIQNFTFDYHVKLIQTSLLISCKKATRKLRALVPAFFLYFHLEHFKIAFNKRFCHIYRRVSKAPKARN